MKAMAHLSDGTTQDVTTGTAFILSDSNLATMSNGAVTAKAPGTLTVQASYIAVSPAGSSPAAASTTPQTLKASATITISPKQTTPSNPTNPTTITPAITWSAPAAITYGTAISGAQLNATADTAGSFSYSPAAGTVLTAGTQTLSVIFAPSDTKNYSAATASVPLSVAQAKPVITWPAPTAISTGTALSATQLNATANVPGTFMYNPPTGSVLAAGTQSLTAVFSPTDATNYASATMQNSLLVNTVTTNPGQPIQPTPPVPDPPVPTPPNPTPTPNPPTFPAPVGCGGPTINLNSGMSQSTLQSSISNAPACSLILFAPGTYRITSSLSVPCNNLTITGPNVFPNSAILNATFNTSAIFTLAGNCTAGLSLEFLAGYNTSLFYMYPGNAANINILHNTTGNLPSSKDPGGPYAFSGSVYFNGTINTTMTNVTIEYNLFGDTNSCNAVFALGFDSGGNCAGFMVHQGKITNLIVKYNKFFHLEEGLHILEVSSYQPGQREATGDNIDIEYNYFLNIHRIEVEDQIGTINHPQIVSNNIYQDQSYAYYGSLGASLPCCQNGGIYAKVGLDPGLQANNNVYINSVHDGLGCLFCGSSSNSGPAFTVEFWGNGSQGNNNLIQGNFGNGFEWGYGSGDWQIEYNQICGPNMARQYANIANYISNEEATKNPPTQIGNVTSASCSAYTSVAPTISPASGTFVAGQTITLSDAGVTSGAGPHGNTSVYYTTDGTNPVPGSGTTRLYTGPFTLAAAGVVKAVGLYGTGGTNPQTWPTVYPAGYGFVPSAVVSATYTSSSVAPAPGTKISESTGKAWTSTGVTSQPGRLLSIAIVPNQPVVAIGRTTQLKATATFGDGSVKDVTTEFQWQSSDARTLTASASGLLTGLATGPATISGSYQGLKASAHATSNIGEVDWSGPTVITAGGTYSGNWQSTDARTAAVTIATKEPVVIENSHIRSMGGLIKTSVAGTNLIVRNSLGVALNANTKGQPNGTFLEVSSPVRLDVENNYIENAQGGVIVHGYGGNRDAAQTITVRSNRARNLNGMLSNGNQGYLPASGSSHSQARFIQFDSVQAVPGIDVGWNEVVNYPGRSLVGDNIEIYRSGGTANHPLEVHDSYIQGAYPYDAAKDVYIGGGIKTDSRAGDGTQEVPAFNSIHDNQVVGTVHYGIQFSAGHDNVASNNRVISSGLLENGTKIASQHVGMVNAEASGTAVSGGAMYNNSMHDNTIGWMCWQSSCAQEGYRRDKYFPVSPADYDANAALATGLVTLETENNEYQVWMNKMAAAGISVGPEF
jgi:Bacterial Ig-like domain (group 2)/Chitobiase/beta-hexosaminidase C-terminal domain